MNNIRLKFTRDDNVKYISHLDLMKAFERAMRRSGIPVAYSQGFNPHAHIVFGLPLSVGVTSEAEYADFDLSESLLINEFIRRINESLPKGLLITDAKYRQTKNNIMALISRATYNISVSNDKNYGIEILKDKIEDFLSRKEIIVKKKTKSGVRDVDIRPMIFELGVNITDSIKQNDGIFSIYTMISAGNTINLKPELLISAISEITGLELEIENVHRTGLYIEKDNKLYDPLDDKVL